MCVYDVCLVHFSIIQPCIDFLFNEISGSVKKIKVLIQVELVKQRVNKMDEGVVEWLGLNSKPILCPSEHPAFKKLVPPSIVNFAELNHVDRCSIERAFEHLAQLF